MSSTAPLRTESIVKSVADTVNRIQPVRWNHHVARSVIGIGIGIVSDG